MSGVKQLSLELRDNTRRQGLDLFWYHSEDLWSTIMPPVDRTGDVEIDYNRCTSQEEAS